MNKCGIFALGLLVVVLAVEFALKVIVALDEVPYPILANGLDGSKLHS
jgi:hypothetical protein